MDGLGIQWDYLVFYIICFIITMWVLNKFLFKPLTKMLTDREESIEKAIQERDNIHEQLQKIEEEGKKIIADAKAEARNILEKAKTEIEPQLSLIENQARSEAEKIVLDSKNQAGEILKSARAQSEKEAFDIVSNILHKALSNLKLSSDVQNQVMSEIIKNLV
jgi:F-type H+-transporting ATPase subunit b